MSVSTIARGETIAVMKETSNHLEMYMVLGPCEHRSLGYYCVTCGEQVANLGNLEMHVQGAGDHAVVAWCGDPKCRVYREADAEQLTQIERML
jgi:hypothetical protein